MSKQKQKEEEGVKQLTITADSGKSRVITTTPVTTSDENGFSYLGMSKTVSRTLGFLLQWFLNSFCHACDLSLSYSLSLFLSESSLSAGQQRLISEV